VRDALGVCPRIGTVLLVLVATLAVSVPSYAQSIYALVEIPDGFGPAYDVNDAGTVVGFRLSGDDRGYVWTETGGVQPMIPTPADKNRFPCYDYFPRSLRINNGGVIAGQGGAVSCGASSKRAATWSSATGIVTLGGGDDAATARGINNNGTVVGTYRGNSAVGFIWESDPPGIQILPLGPQGHDAYDVNDLGQVVGGCSSAATAECSVSGSAYVWSETAGLTVLPKVTGAPDAQHQAFAISNSGFVAGRFVGATHGVFAWSQAAGTVDLGAPAGVPEFVDINNRGEVVATIIQFGGRVPYLFRNGVWTNINSLRPAGATLTLQTVMAINNKGWIVGSGTNLPPAEFGIGWVLIPPTVDVTVNGEDGPLTLGPGDPLHARLAFNTHGLGALTPAETYIAIATSGGVFWLSPTGFTLTVTPLFTGPLPTIAPATLLNIADVSAIPPGVYVWLMVVDADSNGILNGHYFDYVVTTTGP
jgi:uncharacterized membrane protein